MSEDTSLPKHQTYPPSDLYILCTDGILNYEKCISNDFLKVMLLKIETMSGIDIEKTKFILDIDLDYFHSYEALERDDFDIFDRLLSKATAITIATEPSFAAEGINPEKILERILELAKCANNDDIEIDDLRKK